MSAVVLVSVPLQLLSLFVGASCGSIGSNAPNFLLLFPDQWRFDWADEYYIDNLQIATPTFQSIVENGTRFSRTTVASPLCAPSRACLAAGKEYDDCYVPTNAFDFPTNTTTFYKLLQDNGYWLMVSGKDDLTKQSGCGIDGTYRLKELGFDAQKRCKGKLDNTAPFPKATDPFAAYLSSHFSLNHNGENDTEWNITDYCNHYCCKDHACTEWTTVADEAYEDNWITANTLNLLDNIPNNKSWFLQINWAGPHPPFIVTKRMNESVGNRSYNYPMNASENEEDMLNTRRDYTAEIENLDTAFSLIINKIRDLGEYGNTIICVSSDHGEMLGDFDSWQKSQPWVASTNVPFVCMGPGIQRNNTISTYVTNMDIAGTVLDYSSIDLLPAMSTRSLRPFLNGSWDDRNNEYRDYVVSGLNNWRSVVQDVNKSTTWKFICCQGQCPGRKHWIINDGLVELLFNVVRDVYEETDVAHLYPNVVNQLKEFLPRNFCVPGNYTQKWKDTDISDEQYLH